MFLFADVTSLVQQRPSLLVSWTTTSGLVWNMLVAGTGIGSEAPRAFNCAFDLPTAPALS